MKKLRILSLLIILMSVLSCSDTTSVEETSDLEEWRCGTHNGNDLWTGPRGGCYYKNSNENKTYVDRSECNC